MMPLRRRVVRAIVATLMLALLHGCAGTSGPAVLHFGMEDAPEGKRVLWPPPPDVPRYLFAGQLTGEANFRKAAPEGAGLAGFLRMIAGVLAGDAAPVVLQRPHHGVTGEDGRIYVTDMSRQALFVFDQAAGELMVWDKAEGLQSFVAPSAVALAPEGAVLVSDAELGIVVRLDRRGTPVGVIGRGVLRRPTGLARDPVARLLYVADTYAHDIKVFDDEGRLVRIIGRRGEGDGEFNFPTFLAFARGELYVTDTMNNRIQVLTGDGHVIERKFGARGMYVGNLVRPKGVAVDSEGNVYVVESYHDHLLVFDRRGEFLMGIGGTGPDTGRFYLPAGVWIDGRNRVYVADMFNGRIVLFQFLGGGADGEV